MAARMKDIAKALNVSIVTVSKVLNNDLSISEATRQRVLECARKLDYRTNLAAKGLVTGQSKMIGLIVPDLFHGFFAEVAAGMSDALGRHGYGLIISSSRDSAELESKEIRQMLARSVDALIIASCEPQPAALEMAAREVPLVLLDRRISGEPAFQFVGTDDTLAGELATQHLIDIGRRRIAYIGSHAFSPSSDRERAYRAVLSRSKIEVPMEYLVRISGNEGSNHVLGQQCMQKLLMLKPRPDAVFCYNDPTAWGAMAAILEAGLRVPEDIAIVGCGNAFYNSLMRVPLTSVDQNAAGLGSEAAELSIRAIKQRLHKQDYVPASVLLKPTLVVRESTGEVKRRRVNAKA
jgi:LacI family transcriptional regulator